MARLVMGAMVAIAVLVAGMSVAGCTAGCPAALLEGNLVREGADLMVRERSGHIELVVGQPVPVGHRSVVRSSIGVGWSSVTFVPQGPSTD